MNSENRKWFELSSPKRNREISINSSAIRYGSLEEHEPPASISSNLPKTNSFHTGYCHNDDRKENKNYIITILAVICICCLFMIAEVVGGAIANSLAVMTDAAHLIVDLAAYLIAFFALKIGKKQPTQKLSFGFYRIEILGALASILFIWAVTGVLVYLAVERIRDNEFNINAKVMLITASCGVVVNLIIGATLHFYGLNTHGHGHSHGSGDQNINLRAAFIHVIGDVVQSTGVFVSAMIIYFKPNLSIVDPICTFLFSVLVLLTTIPILRDVFNVLMEGTPRDVNLSEVKQALEEIEDVKLVHLLHVWCLTVDRKAASVHLAINTDVESPVDHDRVLRQATIILQEKFKIKETTIQIEDYTVTMSICKECEAPR